MHVLHFLSLEADASTYIWHQFVSTESPGNPGILSAIPAKTEQEREPGLMLIQITRRDSAPPHQEACFTLQERF